LPAKVKILVNGSWIIVHGVPAFFMFKSYGDGLEGVGEKNHHEITTFALW